MKLRRNGKSPFGKTLFFEVHEFESMMDELRLKAGPEVFQEGSGINVDMVLLKALQVEPDFPLLPEGVLGRTSFWPDGKVKIEIDRRLAELAEVDILARRRLRTTLAHEGGHVYCHRDLFLRDVSTISLFADAESNGLNGILCRDEGIGVKSYQGEWWEYQANRCMAALLMPRVLLREEVQSHLDDRSICSFEEAIVSDEAPTIIRRLCEQFDVSQEAMLYRLTDLGFIPKKSQIRMAFVD